MRRTNQIIYIICLACILLVGCASKSEQRWVKEVQNSKELLVTERTGVQYRFDAASWSQDAAEQLVADISSFLSAFGSPEKTLTISFGAKSDNNTELYFADKPTLADYLSIFSAAYGEPEDLVLANGAVAAVCAEKQLCEVEKSYTDTELAAYFSNENTLYLLDLTLPMVENRFVESEEASHARSASVSLAAYCLREHGTDSLLELIFSPIDVPEKTQLKNDWLREIGCQREYEPFALLQYERNHSDQYPYAVIEPSYRFYFLPRDVKADGYQTFIKTYLEFRPLYDLDFAEARHILSEIITEDVSCAEIYTDFSHSIEVVRGIFHVEKNTITMYGGWSYANDALLHEYVHFLTRNVPVVPMVEGLTEAVAGIECKNLTRQAELKRHESAVEAMKQDGLWDDTTDSLDLWAYNLILTLRFCDKDLENYYSISLEHFSRVPEEPTINDFSYAAAAIFAEYMFNLYGKKQVYDCIADPEKMEELWGKPFSEMYDEWYHWVVQSFIDIGGQIDF